MGASPSTDEPRPVPAAVMSTQSPEVRVEEADESDESRVFVEGTMFHDGLNKNAWGLSEQGAQAIADDLIGRDYTAAHPDVRGNKYDRSIAEGKGAPIGEVVDAEVVAVEGADLDGGQYTAEYTAEVKDPVFKERLEAGLRIGGDYGVSIGIYADPESASCSVCGEAMGGEECDHSRGERVEADDGDAEVAGPIYDGGDADHLAHVWRPAYEGATAEVTASAEFDSAIAAYSQEDAGTVLTASAVLAEPFDASDDEDDVVDDEPDTTESSAYEVRVSSDTPTRRQRDRGSYPVQINHD